MRRTAILLGCSLLLAPAGGACGGGGGPPPAGGPVCRPEVEEPLDPGSTRHLLPGSPEPAYASDPPTSGPHLPAAGVTGVQREPLPRPLQVGVLEGGRVLVQHRRLPAAPRARVESLAADDQIVVAPNDALPAPVVATAWRHRLECTGVDVAALEAFAAAHGRAGGEGHQG